MLVVVGLTPAHVVVMLRYICRHRSLVVKDDGKLMDEKGTVVGASLEVTDPKSQSRALSLVGSVDWIQARASI